MPKKDYAKWDKDELISHIEKLESRKKYGLVWDSERVPEKVVAECKENLPVLTEVKSKEIVLSEDKQVHILIEGDNYHALSVLNYTHLGKVNLIYIDPPYNTGKPDNLFYYNDRIVDLNDTWRHSKWLNFMSKRLELAKNLMKDAGIIFISIDDNEVSNLRLLCNSIFGEQNFVACLPTIMNLKGNQDQFGFAGTHEYTLVYCRDKNVAKLNEYEIDDEEMDDWQEDEYGLYKKGANLKGTGVNAPRTKRPYLYYPILVKLTTKEVTSISEEEYIKIYDSNTKEFNDNFVEKLLIRKYKKQGFAVLLPSTDGEGMWGRWKRKKVIDESYNIIVVGEGDDISIYKKQRPQLGELPSKKPKTLFYKPEYSSGNGTAQLKKIFGRKVFNNPKPVDLIKDFIRLGGTKDSIILDFFAGSGTTAQAIFELNDEDGDNGKRQAILCTNNENDICENVTYPRIKAIINPHGNGASKYSGKINNLKYYKTSFVKNSRNSDQLKIDVTKKCTEMLCLKEGIYKIFKEHSEHGESVWKIFSAPNKFMAVYYDFAGEPLETLRVEMNKLKGEKILYCFTTDSNGINEFDFVDWNEIRLEAIPQKILDVYKRINKENQR